MTTFIARDVMRQTKKFIRQPYAWPGGYPQTLVMADGVYLCHDCTRDNYRLIAESTVKRGPNDGWRAAGVGVNWENSQLYCDHCGEKIESAYADS